MPGFAMHKPKLNRIKKQKKQFLGLLLQKLLFVYYISSRAEFLAALVCNFLVLKKF